MGNDFAHGYRPARYRDDQRVLASEVLELDSQCEGRFISIVEHVKLNRVGNAPIIHATPQYSLRFIKAVHHCQMASRTQDNRIDGVVITFVEFSAAKALEATLREALSVLQSGSSDQPVEPKKAKVLENVLKQAQAVLGKH
jgi:hypothetical protein